MVKPKYSNENVIKEKIRELFHDRKLTDLLRISQLDQNKIFIAHLIEVQYRIYLLDAYLESRWDLKSGELKLLWTGIEEALKQINYSKKKIKKLLKEIRAYEKIEMNCRKDKWPMEKSMTRFYTTKSCDVRLIRHLIYDAHPALRSIWKEKAWKYYDRITEINDDVADVKEDLVGYNGNRFLISILRTGREKTKIQYREYLLKATDQARQKVNPRSRKPMKELFAWTQARSQETLKLLEQSVGIDDLEILASAKLMEHMN
jgi:hypothetical protein